MAVARRRTFILGGHITKFIGAKHPDFIGKRHPEFGKKQNPSLEDYIHEAVNGALAATATPAEAIQKAWIGNFAGELFSSQGHLGAAVIGANPALMNIPSMRVEGACASGGLAFACALESIRAGTDIALVVGAEVQTTVSARMGGEYLARASWFKSQREIDDFTFPALFARRIKHCSAAYGITPEDLARVSVKAYTNANKNPLAHMNAVTMDMDTATSVGEKNPAFLTNEAYKDFLRVSDCSQVSDGGAALVLVSEEGLAKLGKDPKDCTEVIASAVATGNLYEDSDGTTLGTTFAAANRAYTEAKIEPSDVDVAEVHDCFTITELLMAEALGLAERGKAKDALAEGRFDIGGEVPINTGGGLVGFGHPVGATGVKQLLEIHRQFQGKCGAYQVEGSPSIGVCANMGGDDKTSVVTVLQRGS